MPYNTVASIQHFIHLAPFFLKGAVKTPDAQNASRWLFDLTGPVSAQQGILEIQRTFARKKSAWKTIHDEKNGTVEVRRQAEPIGAPSDTFFIGGLKKLVWFPISAWRFLASEAAP